MGVAMFLWISSQALGQIGFDVCFGDEEFVGMVVSVSLSGISFPQSWMAAACVHVGEDQGAGMVCGARGCCNRERFIRRQRL